MLKPIPPKPNIKTDCPILTLASLFTAPKPDVIAQPNKAAVFKLKFFGITVNLFSETTAYSLNVVTQPGFTSFLFQ